MIIADWDEVESDAADAKVVINMEDVVHQGNERRQKVSMWWRQARLSRQMVPFFGLGVDQDNSGGRPGWYEMCLLPKLERAARSHQGRLKKAVRKAVTAKGQGRRVRGSTLVMDFECGLLHTC